MESLLDVAPPFPRGSAFMARHLCVESPGALYHFTARGNDQQPIVHDETDRTDFLTRLGQEILPQRWCSAQSSSVTPFNSIQLAYKVRRGLDEPPQLLRIWGCLLYSWPFTVPELLRSLGRPLAKSQTAVRTNL
jgi:hypothetical protein